MIIKREEVRRKILHLSNSIIPLGYYFIIQDKTTILPILIILTVLCLTIDFLRSKVECLKTIFHYFFSSMLRHHELNGKITGASWVLVGSTLTVFFFDKDIAILALLFMSIGDTFAALVGQKYGKYRIGNKTFEGFIGGFSVCILTSFFFPTISWINKFLGSLAASLIELSPINIDDNLTIPIGAGTLMTILRYLGI